MDTLDSEIKSTGTGPSAWQPRILVVDDDDLNRSMMRLLLAQQGYVIEFAANGSEALQAIKSQKYDLVFMDIVLPDMNGRDVCRQVRAWEAGKSRVPIVALTAYDLPGQPLELLKAGMDDYIFKPYNVRQLTRIVRLYTSQPGQASSASPSAEGTQGAEGEVPVLNYEAALLDFSNSVADYQSLLQDFMASLPRRLERMQENYRSGSLRDLAREAHNLRSVSASLGAMQLSRSATELERSCDEGGIAASGQLLEQLGKRVESLQLAAELYLKS
ncbi:MAG: response regulator [Bacteroidota bacterium]